uniref:BTB domain-containing protein n=1 Tax=Panagrolaimus davidi TaxID=227884 RepID=A0A914QTS0_9BILA
MNALLTDRSTKKDEVIKVESHSYDYFYQFLCYLYIGNCELTVDNVREMVDMAVVYDAPHLKKFCDRFLSVTKKIITVENIEDMYDLSQKYSLEEFEKRLSSFIYHNFDELIKPEKFIAFKKPFIQFMSAVEKAIVSTDESHAKRLYNRVKYESFFKAVFKWAENQVTKREGSNDDNFNVQEAIKAELNDILPHIEFWKMTFDFLINFVVEKGFFLSSDELEKFFCFRFDCENEEDYIKSVYQLAEKQALKKQKMIPGGQSFSVADSIKADLAGIIPRIKFFKLKKSFLMDFVVEKGILSEEQANCVFYSRIQIQHNGNTVTGVFKDDFGILKEFNKRHPFQLCTKQGSDKKIRYDRLKVRRPTTPAALTKMKGVAWYLCLEEDGILTFKHHSIVQRSDYLISEMNSENEFVLNPEYPAHLTACFNNI